MARQHVGVVAKDTANEIRVTVITGDSRTRIVLSDGDGEALGIHTVDDARDLRTILDKSIAIADGPKERTSDRTPEDLLDLIFVAYRDACAKNQTVEVGAQIRAALQAAIQTAYHAGRADGTKTEAAADAALSPIGALIAKVETAIAEYDKTGDHKHVLSIGGDCLRCRLASAWGAQ